MAVFLGWMPGDAQRAAFAALREALEQALPAGAPRHDWRSARQWHVTLCYLGESVDDERLADVGDAVEDIAALQTPIDVTLDGVQFWPGPSVLVARLGGDPALMSLFDTLATACHALGFARESRRPNPHVTLAYLPRGNRPPVLPDPLPQALAPLRLDHVALLRTVRGGYDTLVQWPLRDTAAP